MKSLCFWPFAIALAAGAFPRAVLRAQPLALTDTIPLCVPADSSTSRSFCGEPWAADLPNGVLGVAACLLQETGGPETVECRVERLDRFGHRLGRIVLMETGRTGNDFREPALAADGSTGGFASSWYLPTPETADLWVRWYDGSGRPLTGEPVLAGESRPGLCNLSSDLAVNPAGRTLVVWEEDDGCDHRRIRSIGMRFFGPDHQPLGPVVHLMPRDEESFLAAPRVEADPRGRFLVVWQEAKPASARTVRAQRFGPAGNPIGEPFLLRETGAPADWGILPLPDGGLVVVWQIPMADGDHLWLRRYGPEGLPQGPPVDAGAPAKSFLRALDTDRHGNLALIWHGPDYRLYLRLFNRDLVAQGAPLGIGPAFDHTAALALADTGRLLTVQIATGEEVAPPDRIFLAGRLWQARREADACVQRGHRLLCDTAGDGGLAESWSSLPVDPWQSPHLADVDGDGRDDPCIYDQRTGRFSCDPQRQGVLSTVSAQIGRRGDLPLMGDLDSDGRDEPCVRRGRQILCGGGPAPLQLHFGRPAETVLLGDPDGDRRDDPCVQRQGFLLCDTAHDGGAGELALDLRSLAAGGTPLLGDVTGDGRDEACLFTGDRFVCGIYRTTGGRPVGKAVIFFGRPGDVPLLGDLDAF